MTENSTGFALKDVKGSLRSLKSGRSKIKLQELECPRQVSVRVLYMQCVQLDVIDGV